MRDQRGFTLLELMLAMTMSLVAAGAGLSLLGIVGQRNVDVARHSDRVSRAQVSLEAMTRELRQASWLQFHSSLVIDAQVPVRPDPALPATERLVRIDCTTGTTCERLEGPPTGYPPPTNPVFETRRAAIENLRPGSVVFTPQAVDPDTGATETRYINPTTIAVSIEVIVPDWDDPVRLDDTVTLRNATTFAEDAS